MQVWGGLLELGGGGGESNEVVKCLHFIAQKKGLKETCDGP